MTDLSISERTEGDATIVALAGSLDLASRDGLVRTVESLLGRGARRCVIDLRAVDFLDSSGIAALVRCLRLADESGAALGAACGEGPAGRVLRGSGIDAILPLHTELTSALSAT